MKEHDHWETYDHDGFRYYVYRDRHGVPDNMVPVHGQSWMAGLEKNRQAAISSLIDNECRRR